MHENNDLTNATSAASLTNNEKSEILTTFLLITLH